MRRWGLGQRYVLSAPTSPVLLLPAQQFPARTALPSCGKAQQAHLVQ